MKKKNINELIRKYLTSSIDPSELLQLQNWLNEDQSHRDMFRDLERIWREPSEEPEMVNSYELIDKIWSEGVEKKRKVARDPRRFDWSYITKIAASFLIIVAAVAIIYQFYQISPEEESSPQYVVKANPSGQKTKVYLSDGSIAWLNADTRITYRRHFKDSIRVIELSGEAYFEVAKDPSKPFVVTSGALSVRALGTSFNVSAYPDQPKTQVSLLTGSVKIEMINNSRDVVLSPGQQIVYNKNSEEFTESVFDPVETIGWKEGILIFKQASYQEVVRKLERWFGIEINTQGAPPDDWQLTAHYEDEVLINILKDLEFGKGFNYELDEELLTIKF